MHKSNTRATGGYFNSFKGSSVMTPLHTSYLDKSPILLRTRVPPVEHICVVYYIYNRWLSNKQHLYLLCNVFLFPIFRVIKSSNICTPSPLYKAFLLLMLIVFGYILFQSNRLISRQYEMFGVNTSHIDYIVNTARRMDVKPVMVTLVNDAYLPFVYNWLCNTRDMLLPRQVC